ncbi:MAG TPA: phosphoserine transaminase [Acidimicrobiales bacterium]|nr:phosphoserine transaminase [Acidimicrobiales bacterium]
MAAIEIPKELLPSDGRFGAGPSKIRSEALDELLALAPTYLGTSHRQATVKDVVGRIRSGISRLFSIPEGYEVVLGNGGSTAFWDVATFCLIERKSQHLSFGEFSSKFAQSSQMAPFLEDPIVITSETGTHPDAVAMDEIDCYGLTHNETSTGVMMNITRPRYGNSSPAEGIVVVDATSAAGGIRVDIAETDVYYFAPQKCFGSDGGLWIAIMSPKALERSALIGASGRYIPPFLDLNIAIENSRLDQTYNTPALVTLMLLAEQVEWFNANGGLAWSSARSDASATILYGWAETSPVAEPFVKEPKERSTVVGTIDFVEGIDASAIAKVLRANGIVDTEPYRKLGRNQLRISMFPGVESSDIERLTGCIDYVIAKLS